MERVTPTVFTDTTLRGCNPSFVVTSDGVVVIDTPQLPRLLNVVDLGRGGHRLRARRRLWPAADAEGHQG